MGQHWDNPEPGTVIDRTVTRFSSYDFYLVSQLVRQVIIVKIEVDFNIF